MAFPDTGGGNLDKFGFVLHVVYRCAATVTHAGPYAARHLVNDGHHRSLVGHAAFNAFGHQFVGVWIAGGGLLEVAVGAALLHRTDAAHAAVALVTSALVEDDFAGRFFRASKHAAHHHAAGAGGDGLGNVTAVTDAAVGNQRYA